MSEWQPIETAPHGMMLLALAKPLTGNDVTGWTPFRETHVVLGWRSYDGGFECCFTEEGTADTEGHSFALPISVTPTHWMPLPSPPEGGK